MSTIRSILLMSLVFNLPGCRSDRGAQRIVRFALVSGSSCLCLTVAMFFASTTIPYRVQGQNRVVEWSAHPLVKIDASAVEGRLADVEEAVEIIDVKVGDVSITVGDPFLAGDDWLRGLRFRMKNVSGRPIIGARLSFGLPETKVGNNSLGFSLEYGRGESTGITSDQQKVVMPNDEFELKFNDRQYQGLRQFFNESSSLSSFSKITIGNLAVKFDDGSIWIGGCLRASDPSNSCRAPAV